MALPKIRFSWRPLSIEDAKWRFGLFCFYDARAKSAGRRRAWRLIVSLRGMLAWLSVFAVIGYFAGAGVLWSWLHRHPYSKVTYTDLVWPPHWSQLQQKRGQAMIAEGLADFKNQKWAEGGAALRVGLARSPNEPAARLQLADFYVAINQRILAKKILTDGLAYGYPGDDYFKRMCMQAAEAEDYGWWLATCDTVLGQLAGQPGLASARKAALLQKMAALLAAGRTNEVLRLVEDQGANPSAMFDEFKVLALLKAGRAADAVAFLEEWRKRDPASQQVMMLQVRAFREAGRLEDMSRAITDLCASGPSTPQPYIYGVVQNLIAGRRSQADQGVDDFLLRFGSAPSVLFMLVESLSEIDEQPILERLIGYARQQGFGLEPFQRALARVLIDKGDWRHASDLLAAARASGKASQPALTVWYDLMDRLCDAALDPAEGTQSVLIDFVRNCRLPLKIDRQLIEGLRRAGRPATARELITFAQGGYPENETLNVWRDELDKELAAVSASQPIIVLPKTPLVVSAPEKLEPARRILNEAAFFNRLKAAKKAGDFAVALQQIQELREARPDWLVSRQDEIESEEIFFNGRVGDLPAMHLAAGFYLNGDAQHSLKAASLAKELYAAGCKEAAIMLAKDLLRKAPDYPPTRRLLAEWEPKPPTAKP